MKHGGEKALSNCAVRRLYNQRLAGTRLETPVEVVGWLGAVQAQDYAGAKWALGLRMKAATDEAIERAFNEGLILRTHLMRPTWHFVTLDDIRWLLALTGPRVNAANGSRYRQLELNDAVLGRSNDVIASALEGGQQLTRPELAAALEQAGISTQGQRLAHIVMRAELDGVVCSGPRRGKQFTYALLDERTPQTESLTREEALAELTRRYFTSHGPALIEDFVWWSGLTKGDARAGLEAVGGQLVQEVVEGKAYWLAPSAPPAKERAPTALLLPPFDEYTVAYRDRSPILDPNYSDEFKEAALAGVIVIEGQVVGNWRRTFSKGAVVIGLIPFRPFTVADDEAFAAAAQRYGAFLEMPVTFA